MHSSEFQTELMRSSGAPRQRLRSSLNLQNHYLFLFFSLFFLPFSLRAIRARKYSARHGSNCRGRLRKLPFPGK